MPVIIPDYTKRVDGPVPKEYTQLLTQLLKHHADTLEHSYRVARLATSVASYITLDPIFIMNAYVASLFHDIGKLFTPVEILDAERGLTTEERAIIDCHSVTGANLLYGMNMEIRLGVAWHHMPYASMPEYNGIANLIHVCDVYDALISPRSYKDALPVQQAVKTLEDNKVSGFCPVTVAALRKYVLHE